ncbi:hypothetical protein [Aeoliella mucimassa]|uniref:Uncharacterized protein n=1 Tax=Aeoliella mucimassa TaxID=2527972 RepID=A0A518AJ75_9BACT|nr:hypothetical protein [Aeoliella mucimassa]QDU54788.1 hypothetical protein Pan181_09710 [Aeoliella mucimassa]
MRKFAFMFAVAGALVCGLGCSSDTVEKTEEAGAAAGEAIESAAGDAVEGAKEAAEAVEEGVSDMVDGAEDAADDAEEAVTGDSE